jgi:hypothetical protein
MFILALGALALAVAVVVPGSQAQGAGQTFSVVGVLRKSADGTLNLRPSTTEVNSWRLNKPGTSDRIGRQLDDCVFAFAGHQYCQSAFYLRGRGSIIAEGDWNPARDTVVLPVTGGSREFVNAGGVARFELVPSNGPEKVKVTFVLR